MVHIHGLSLAARSLRGLSFLRPTSIDQVFSSDASGESFKVAKRSVAYVTKPSNRLAFGRPNPDRHRKIGTKMKCWTPWGQ